MPPVSVVICCRDAAETIGPACLSASWAQELVVVDSGSCDDTPRIARRYAHRFVSESWRGYSAQKQFAASLASHDWVFVLDADETITPELGHEIGALPAERFEAHDVFLVRRRNYMFGRHVRAWDPDWQSRLIHRVRARWTDDVLHENRLPGGSGRLGRLGGAIEHKRYSRAGFEDYFSGRRLDERLLMVARDMLRRGRRCSTADLLFRPPLALLKHLVLRGGFRQGGFGVLLAQKTAVTTQLKYAALWAVQNGLESGQRLLEEPPVPLEPPGTSRAGHGAGTQAP
jgi:(heptosyl)LPS beta-1,4-glucosyltransferase